MVCGIRGLSVLTKKQGCTTSRPQPPAPVVKEEIFTTTVEENHDGSDSNRVQKISASDVKTSPAKASSDVRTSPDVKRKSTVPLQTEEEFKKRYEMRGVLGNGNFSVVKRAYDKQLKVEVAVKDVDSRKLTKDDMDSLHIEVSILSSLQHPNVIKMYGWYEESKHYLIVTELMKGGELFDRIVQKEFYSEADATKVVMTVAQVLKYLHDQGIVHRDLKPENILLTDKTENAAIKIADFGFAKPVNQGLVTACGTPGYVAPEIINGHKYGKSVDVWSLGVIIYILLSGYPPFYNQNQAQLFKTIREGKFAYDSPYWDNVSAEAKNLITSCLTVDVSKRITIDGVLAHAWLSTNVASGHDLTAALGEIKKFNAKRKLRAGIKAAIAANRLIAIAESLRKDSVKQ